MDKEFPVKNFLGLNLRDAADKVADNEFTQLQNVYQPTKGILARRFGSTADLSSFPLANRVSGIWRHYLPSGNRYSIYHCEPTSALLPDNTSDLTLVGVTDGTGDIFGGGAKATLRFCYSWVGVGAEQTYNTKNRSGFSSLVFPLDAWSNTSHQSISLVNASDAVNVTIPAFPTGVRAANIFMATGTATQMTYVGSITVSAGTLTVRNFVGPIAARFDALTFVATATTGGTLAPGTYYVGAGWVIDSNVQEGDGSTKAMPIHAVLTVNVLPGQSAISVSNPVGGGAGGISQNGAQSVWVFIGTQPLSSHPSTCVGIVKYGQSLVFNSIPSHNGQSTPILVTTDTTSHPAFYPQVNDFFVGGPYFDVGTGKVYKSRHGFLLAKDQNGVVNEVFPSRSHVFYSYANNVDPFTGATITAPNFYSWFEAPKTANDTYRNISDVSTTQPYNYIKTITDPQFTYNLGMSYFTNGGDIPWQTDGITLGQIGKVGAVHGTLLPPFARFIFAYQNSLVTAGADQNNQLYASNANNPNNWATGGDGLLLRYASIGDATGSGVTAMGIFTPASEATSNPNSFMIAFKKNGTWMVQTISDPSTTGSALYAGIIGGAQVPIPLTQVSGRVGCVAYRTVVQTPLGTLFLGQDGNIYLISAVREPQRIGTKIQNGLSHLVGNDVAMQACTAVYHDNHYKLSYPSATAILTNPIRNDQEFWADLRTDENTPITWVGPHTGRSIGAQLVLVGDGDDLSRLAAFSSSLRTCKLDDSSTYADLQSNGSTAGIQAKIRSKIFRFNKEAHIKRVLGMFLDIYMDSAFTNNILVEGFADFYYQQINRQLSAGGATWDSSQFDQSFFSDAIWSGYSFLFGPDNLVGRTFQWALTTSDQAPFILASSTLLVKGEKRRIIN